MGFRAAEEAILSDEYDIVVLDEINQAVHLGIIHVDEVLELLDKKPPLVEVVLTGRNAHQALIQRADLVTEMKIIKHPFEKGIPSRRGIEY
jgi:cob(I)alamin adenosyltransferase